MDDRGSQGVEKTWRYWKYALLPLTVLLSIPLIFSACYQWLPGLLVSTVLILVLMISCFCIYKWEKRMHRRAIPLEVEREWPRAPARPHAPDLNVNTPQCDPNPSIPPELRRQTNPPPSYAAVTEPGNTPEEVGIELSGWRLATLSPK